MRKTILALTMPMLLLACGCGGGGGSSSGSQLSAADLKSQANAICADLNKKTAKVSKPQDLDAALSATNDGIKKLEALKPPDSLKDKYKAFIDQLHAGAPILANLVKAVDAKDIAKAQALSAQADTANRKVDAAATAVGLDQCAAD
jgi:hypothetical protein